MPYKKKPYPGYKRLRRKRKTKVKFYKEKGLKCQGKKELRFVKECVRYNKPMPKKAKRIETKHGYYTPDFEFPEKFVEIKSLGTFRVMLGEIAYKGIGEPSDLQWRKIQWVAENVKPIEIIVYLSRREYKPECWLCIPNITITFKGGYKPKK